MTLVLDSLGPAKPVSTVIHPTANAAFVRPNVSFIWFHSAQTHFSQNMRPAAPTETDCVPAIRCAVYLTGSCLSDPKLSRKGPHSELLTPLLPWPHGHTVSSSRVGPVC